MVKYESTTKHHRNQSIVQVRREHPELSLAEIGKAFGISGKRVWYILDREEKLRAACYVGGQGNTTLASDT
uniref:Putative sigma-70 region domain containing protein n=1 Tax=viral metagenome TaxID=1070528 RepID=A0A6H2A5Z8_9ZZZZ